MTDNRTEGMASLAVLVDVPADSPFLQRAHLRTRNALYTYHKRRYMQERHNSLTRHLDIPTEHP